LAGLLALPSVLLAEHDMSVNATIMMDKNKFFFIIYIFIKCK